MRWRFATVSPMPHPVRVIAVLALATVAALTGCSSGQVTQTARQESTVNGVSADVGDLALRDVRILYPSSGTYRAGSTAQLAMAVVNRGLDEDRLVEVTGDFFDAASAPSEDSRAQRSAEPGDEPSIEAVIPPQGSLQFGTAEFPTIQLMELSDELSAAQVVSVTFVFENAGEVTVEVPVANPTRAIDREEEFDYHHDEG